MARICDWQSGSRNQTNDLTNATFSVLRRMRFQNAYRVPYSTLVEGKWSLEERKKVEEAALLIPQAQLAAINVQYTDYFRLDHPVLPPNADHVSAKLSFEIHQPLGPVRLWPREWTNTDADINCFELRKVCNNIIYDALDRYAVKHALVALRNRCDTHEQAITLMPFWRNLCTMAGLHKQAELSVERVPSKMPLLSEQTRRAIRHANGVLAAHILLGTIGGSYTHPEPNTHECTVTLDGNHYVTFDTDAGVNWEIDLEE